MANNDGPKVFGNGDVTVALGQNGAFRLYVGQKPVECAQRVRLDASADNSRPVVEVHFPAAGGGLDVEIEENARALAAYSWIRVVRQ